MTAADTIANPTLKAVKRYAYQGNAATTHAMVTTTKAALRLNRIAASYPRSPARLKSDSYEKIWCPWCSGFCTSGRDPEGDGSTPFGHPLEKE